MKECVNTALKLTGHFLVTAESLVVLGAHPSLTSPLSCHDVKENILEVLELLAS